MLHDPERHEKLIAAPWDEGAARAAIDAIVADALARGSPDALWPAHPLDIDGHDLAEPFAMMYMGAAGVVFALDWLARRGVRVPVGDFAAMLDALPARNLALVGPWGRGATAPKAC